MPAATVFCIHSLQGILTDTRNLALRKPAVQSSVAFGGVASRVTDGFPEKTSYGSKSVAHNWPTDQLAVPPSKPDGEQTYTGALRQGSFLYVDLADTYNITHIRISVRSEGNTKFNQFRVGVSSQVIW